MTKPAASTYKDAEKKKISSDSLRSKLKLKNYEVKSEFSKKHPHAEKYFNFKGFNLTKLREHSAKAISSGALAGALLLAPPSADFKHLPTPQEVLEKFRHDMGDSQDGDSEKKEIDSKKVIVETISQNLPETPRPLNRDEEKMIEQVFGQVLGISAKATLEGEHLNTTYGYIGAEQHLRRFPGDTLSLHGDKVIQKEGIAPGLGAWGYFANSRSDMTEDLEKKEKWYAVVQTLYLNDWNIRQPFLKDWYKFRKVLIVNTINGHAVVASVADSGPAAWTGKQYGGSPEVMHYLGGSKYKKGPVIIFFVDDPENKVPLGPVN